jgi:hypothetical protein
MRQFGWSVGYPTYVKGFCSCASPDSGPRVKQHNRLSIASCFVRREAVSIAQYQGRIHRSVVGLREGFTMHSESPTVFRTA